MKFWIPGPQRAYGTTPRGFQGEIQVVRASDYDLVAHANKVQAEEIHALRKALAQSTILNGSDFVLAYPGCPDCWRVKPEDMPARAAVQQPAPQPAAALVRIKRRMKELWETVPTRADPGSYYLGRSTGTADTLRAIQEEIDRAADQQPTSQPDAAHPLVVDGVRHASSCRLFAYWNGRDIPPDCNCGATPDQQSAGQDERDSLRALGRCWFCGGDMTECPRASGECRASELYG